MTDITDRPWPAKLNVLPKEVFVNKDIFEKELERIFYGPEWHAVCHESEVPEIGDFKSCQIGKVPLFATRGDDKQVRVFFNSCSHRGNQIVTESMGNKQEFECPYHRWLFSKDGQLVGCPSQKEYSPGFKKENYPLKQPRTESYKGLIFVTFSSDTASLLEWLGERTLGPLSTILADDGRLKLLGYQKVRYKANWKAYNDNDGFHAPLLHRAFSLLNWQGGKGIQYDVNERHWAIESQLSQASDTDLLNDSSIIEFKGVDPSTGSRVLQLFPMFVATKHLDMINLRFSFAIDAETTEVHYAYFSHLDDDEELARHRLRQSSNLLGPCGLISMEDASIFHRIHIGVQTPGTVEFQKGVSDFYTLSPEIKQNDESGNLPRWEYYRKVMGFKREQVQ
ncbi:MAG: aromatic ring-hydroxylating dioxygenase subunit alpha [Gammaproteobacteria bacterium]|nr:aromatic ring-hydroxylating dioxygenase subunit alpha [Gammaproteobacteria bacterium]